MVKIKHKDCMSYCSNNGKYTAYVEFKDNGMYANIELRHADENGVLMVISVLISPTTPACLDREDANKVLKSFGFKLKKNGWVQ